MELLKAKEMADKLKVSRELFRAIWRDFPHLFAGRGQDLRSARFIWDKDALMEAVHGSQKIQNKGRASIPCGSVQGRGQNRKQGRFQVAPGGPRVGEAGQERSDLQLEAARLSLI